VRDALDEAAEFRRRADWKKAEAALERADGRLGGDGPDELFARLGQARQDLKTVAELESIRVRQLTLKNGSRERFSLPAAYAAALGGYGLDLESGGVDEPVGRVEASPIKEQLVAALDAWAAAEPDAARRGRLLEVLRRTAPNPWRDRFWAAAGRGDREGLKQLAADWPPDRASPTLTAVLAFAVVESDADAALGLLDRAQQLRPEDFWSNAQLGFLLQLYKPGDRDRAMAYERAALALRPDNAFVAAALGLATAEQGRRDEARALFRRAVAADPDFPVANYMLGLDLLTDGKPKEAEALFRTTAERHPDLPTGHLGLGNALVAQGRWEEAVAPLTRAVELWRKQDLSPFDIGPALREFRGSAAGDDARYVELARTSDAAPFSLGLVLFKLGRAGEAADALREAVQARPDNADAHYYLGLSLMKLAKPAEAADAFREVVARDADRAEGHYWLGLSLLQSEKEEEAAEAFRKAADLKADYAEPRCGLGLALLKQGKPADAADAFREALKLKADDEEANDGLGMALLKLDKYDDAADAFRAALKVNADDAEAHCGLGRALTAQDKPDDALVEFKRAVTIAPDDPACCYYLGLAVMLSDPAEAAKLLRKTADRQPDNADAFFFLGYALYERERWAEAAGPLVRAVELAPENAKAHLLLGASLMYQGQFADGLKSLRRARELEPGDEGKAAALMLQLCERLTELDKKLPAILKGDKKPGGPDEAAEFAELCLKYGKEKYAAAVRLYVGAFADKPALADDWKSDNRLNAARAAARASHGEGDAAGAGAEQRGRWRRQALDWLRADLAARRAALTDGTAKPEDVREALRKWADDADLAGVRDPAALGDLPKDEREAWAKLWADVEAALRQAGGEKP
jgi:tetratricopeptide (TPR) repeat protein